MTSHPAAAVGCSARSLIRPMASLLSGAGLALLASWASAAAVARELPSPPPAIAAGPSAPAAASSAGLTAAAQSSMAAGRGAAAPTDDAGPGSGSTAEQGGGGTAASPSSGSAGSAAAPADGASPPASAPASDGTAEPRAAVTATSPPEAGSSVSPPAGGTGSAPDATGGVSAGMPVWRLFAVDAGAIFTAPAHWTARDWTVFGIGAASVVGLTFADKHLRTEALRGDAPLETKLANDFRYFGNYAAFGVLGAFYIGGRIGHDNRAQETALDGLIASVLAGGVIAGVLKEVTGRYRPSTHRGVYTFKPFSGNASFPSGESTEAFAAGSVIATQYPNIWVEIASYGTASLVAFARMREDAHWASDVVAGALIGTTVGRAVVHLNKRLRARVSVAPLLAPGAQGLTIHTAF